MRILYLDCGMGAAGDMLAAALLELLPDREGFIREFNNLGIPGVTVSGEESVKCGICGTHFQVNVHGGEEDDHLHSHHHDHDHHHHHGSMNEIRAIVSALSIPTMVKLDILAVYNEIAQAESHIHGVPVTEIHFHEVGTMDAIADITAVCLLMHRLEVDQVIASPVHVGSGTVRCAHGILPVPAPATAHLLKGIPISGGDIQGELCTPTGAALLKHFVTEFGPLPSMQMSAVGYGMGKKDFPRANCLRAMLGTQENREESVIELRCNVDDMTGEAVGFAIEHFMEQGALDAFTIPIGMKKSRPGLLITVLCRESDREKFVQLIFRHTTTLGIREAGCVRYTLSRKSEVIDTPWGPVRRKTSQGYGVHRSKFEYEDLARVVKATGRSLEEIKAELHKL